MNLHLDIAAHSSIPAWRIPWTEEPGGPQSLGSQGVGHDWATYTHTHRVLLSNVWNIFKYLSGDKVVELVCVSTLWIHSFVPKIFNEWINKIWNNTQQSTSASFQLWCLSWAMSTRKQGEKRSMSYSSNISKRMWMY